MKQLARKHLGVLVMALSLSAVAAASSVPWSSLSNEQKQALGPLQQDWAALEAPRQQKWLEVAERFRSMPAEDRARIQQRMSEWARMTPKQRTSARLQFQEAQWVPVTERQAHWEAYQALSDDEKVALARRARPASRAASAPLAGAGRSRASPGEVATAKRNLVPTATVQRPRAVTSTTVQAKPGATTTSIAKRAAPPAHHQAGLPKIVATPGFVDPATMLPQRGPQGAAVRSAATSTNSTPTQ